MLYACYLCALCLPLEHSQDCQTIDTYVHAAVDYAAHATERHATCAEEPSSVRGPVRKQQAEQHTLHQS